MSRIDLSEIDIILIDDDVDVLESYQRMLHMAGFRIIATSDPMQILTHVDRFWKGIVVSDIYMPAIHGLEILSFVVDIDTQLPVIMITGHGDIPLAIESVKKGAFEFVEKPLNPSEFLTLLDKALKTRRQTVEQRDALARTTENVLIGNSAQMITIRKQIQHLSETDKDVMIEGDLGTGRHTAVRLLHHLNPKCRGELVLLDTHDCDQEMIQYQFQQAEGGTCVIHSPDKLPMQLQRWLSSYLLSQERQGTKKHRTIAVFTGEAECCLVEGKLDAELYYYFSQYRLNMPSLLERNSDIIPLFRAFLRRCAKRLNVAIPKIEPSYLDMLKRYTWPGNVRELRGVAELYAVGIMKLTKRDVDETMPITDILLDDLVDDYEKKIIENTLYLFSGRVSEAASYLGIPRKKLYLRMRKYHLNKDDFKPH
ncbi:sigma-54-dependent Fis family transcriptional regulator [Photobacterium sp. WH24]|uniref:sigma-54-dependent transcriptional regulator n=1 Tax=Photobacterium sp. WH24 TaxID=2827237 RepID=UPI001C46AF6F|nr:response regulator [Photobacterium sp. WH24]MBV7262798.1 sigma-54-dependent Fis family transcriptional regulator [Photobacterium sp. WH24]